MISTNAYDARGSAARRNRSWFISLFLMFGTAAQAWFQVREYSDALDNAKTANTEQFSTVRKKLLTVLAQGTRLLGQEWRWLVFLIPVFGWLYYALKAIGLCSAIALIWLTKKKILTIGGKEADRLKQLVRLAVPWYLLLVGSSFVLAGAAIQLALGWPWQAFGPK